MTLDELYMTEALQLAKRAEEIDEVPVGALIVHNGEVIARAYNTRETSKCATHHAELLAIEEACRVLGGWRLPNTTLYVTMEPCCMCAGAIVNARIKKVYFGAYEKKSGCAESKYPVLSDSGLNHKTEFIGGVERERCENLIKNYFKGKRIKKNLDLN
jgi:tRNA(adenine34) deaminase